MTKELTCPHCGHTGADVVSVTTYTSGKGYGITIECQDRVACWKRWNEQHLDPTEVVA